MAGRRIDSTDSDKALPERRTISIGGEGARNGAVAPEARVGTVVSKKYRVEGVIGQGGMGVVVSAIHLELDERVALKFLTIGSKATAVARFRREARIAIRLRNEHVARLMDVGTLEDGEPYIVMEHLSGETLSRRLRRAGPFAVEDAVDVVLQACEGVAEAHRLGIVHRDLKPSNLFLTERPDGSPLVKVLDFGIAKLLDRGGAEPSTDGPVAAETAERPERTERSLHEGGEPTDASAVLGSLAYMSPEQLRGSRAVDERTDVWALAVILCELLTGEHPFSHEAPQAVARAIESEAPRIELPTGERRAELTAVIARCLSKAPGDRPQTIADLATALVPFAAERSKLSAERAVRILAQRAVSHEPNVLEDDLPATTGTGWGASGTAPKSRIVGRRGALSFAALALVMGAATLVWWIPRRAHQRPNDRATAEPAFSPARPLPGDSADYDDLVGYWRDAPDGFGDVTIGGNWGGYTDTFKTGPGMLEFWKTGDHEYEGTWSESKLRHGSLKFVAASDHRHLDGTWTAASDCTIGEQPSGDFHFTRRGAVDPKGSATLAGFSPEYTELSGDWIGNHGQITVRGNWAGYSMFEGGPGLMRFEKTGEHTYAGTWSDSDAVRGKITLEVSANGQEVHGHKWRVPDVPGENHPVQWIRRRD